MATRQWRHHGPWTLSWGWQLIGRIATQMRPIKTDITCYVCMCMCFCVGHTGEQYMQTRLSRSRCSLGSWLEGWWTRVGSGACITPESRSQQVKGNLWACPPNWKALGDFAAVYAKTTEPIDIPFGLTYVGNNDKHVLSHILPEPNNHTYKLRPRRHELTLAINGDARNVFERQLFKDIIILITTISYFVLLVFVHCFMLFFCFYCAAAFWQRDFTH